MNANCYEHVCLRCQLNIIWHCGTLWKTPPVWSSLGVYLSALSLQINECSSGQIEGLSCMRPNLTTLSIHHSTETMMVDLILHLLRSMGVACVLYDVYWAAGVFWLSAVSTCPRSKWVFPVGGRGGVIWLSSNSCHSHLENPDYAGYEPQQHQHHWQIRGEENLTITWQKSHTNPDSHKLW